MKKWSFSRWLAKPAWLLIFPLLYLLPGLSGFPFPGAAGVYSDVAVAHYPYAIFLKRSLLEWGTIPLWCNTILSGFPFYANPLSGLWYPPGWLALLLPLPLGFNLVAGLHLVWGGWGAYHLLRIEGASSLPAAFGGLVFSFLPKILAHYGAGHLTLIYAVSWTPWLAIAVLIRNRHIETASRISRFLQATGWRDGLCQAGVVLGVILLADVRWGFYAYLLVAILLALEPYPHNNQVNTGWLFLLRSLAKRGAYLLAQGALGALLAAPLILPLMNYTRLTTRTQMSGSDVFTLSLPVTRLLGLALPDFGGLYEWVLYPGAGVLLLTVAAWVGASNRVAVGRWTLLAGISLILALGSNFPLLDFLGEVPGFSLLRVPARSLFLFGMSLALLAGHGLDALQSGIAQQKRRALRLAWFAWTLLAGALGVVIAISGGSWSDLWGFIAALACSFCLFSMLNFPGRKIAFEWGIIAIFLIDAGVYNYSLITFRPASVVLGEHAEAAAWLSGQSGLFRTYSPSYSLPQQTAVSYGLELADGVDPLQLAEYTEFMSEATGVRPAGYSVTLPPFPDGDVRRENSYAEPDARQLGLLNVKYIVSEFELAAGGFDLVRRFGETRTYSNQFDLGRAWVQPVGTVLGEDIVPVEVTKWSPNEIEVRGIGPGKMVLSELDYPGWQASVDGQMTEIQAAAGLLRSVSLDPGVQTVIFRFIPPDLFVGLGLFAAGVTWVLVSSSKIRTSRKVQANGKS